MGNSRGDVVAGWLEGAGLGQYAPAFARLDERAFCGLLMQDYAKYGVTALEHKQKLFRLLKAKRAAASAAPPASAAAAPEPAATPPRPRRPSRQAAKPGRDGRAGGADSVTSHPLASRPGSAQNSPTKRPVARQRSLGQRRASAAKAAPRRAAPPPEEGEAAAAAAAAEAPPAAPAGAAVGDIAALQERMEGLEAAEPAGAGAAQSPSRKPGQAWAAGGSAAEPRPAAKGKREPKIRVCVRKRPQNRKELERQEDVIIDMDCGEGSMEVHEPKVKVDLTKYIEQHEFQFDSVFDAATDNETVYQATVGPLLHNVFSGGRTTCFAFGQTGSGKTYTMRPLPGRTARDMFKILQHPTYAELELWVSIYEIYGGKVFDLLNERNQLVMREDGKKNVNIVGLQEHNIDTVEGIEQLMRSAEDCRSTGSTGANAESSRSHCIMQFALKRPVQVPAKNLAVRSQPAVVRRVVGKLSFIDLAGSERGADTDENDKKTRLEGAEINKSLLALKECIRALDMEARHVPFRGSKLTEVLRDSFIGAQSRTVMIANISPSSGSCENTLNTLRYADRVKEMRRERASSVTAAAPAPLNPIVSIQAKPRPAEAPAEGKPAEAASAAASNVLNDKKRNVAKKQGANKVKDGGVGVVKVGAENIIPEEGIADEMGEAEEKLISAHRLSIEETMDYVRKEMNLLADVDQPGSSLESYIAKLGTILASRKANIEMLQQRLGKFEARVKRRN